MRFLLLLVGLSALAVLSPAVSLGQATPKPIISVLHRFTGSDGQMPAAPLVQASDGNLYGTTFFGGDDGQGCAQVCQGTVFKITPDGQFTLLHTFSRTEDGLQPSGGLVEGPDGYLYGTTSGGGVPGVGTVFKIGKSGEFQKLHEFCSPAPCNITRDPDGRLPYGLIPGADGYLFGRTSHGGNANGNGEGGTLFRISPSGDFKTILDPNTLDTVSGGRPLLASDGNLYLTTATVVLRVTPAGKATVLYRFTQRDGPSLELMQATDGYLYGIAALQGVVFRLSLDGTYQRLHVLDPLTEGLGGSTFVQGSDGNLWSTTGHNSDPNMWGSVYTLTTSGKLVQTTPMRLYETGGVPSAPLLVGRDGKLYGTASTGGNDPRAVPVNGGTVFVVDPSGAPPPAPPGQTFAPAPAVVPPPSAPAQTTSAADQTPTGAGDEPSAPVDGPRPDAPPPDTSPEE